MCDAVAPEGNDTQYLRGALPSCRYLLNLLPRQNIPHAQHRVICPAACHTPSPHIYHSKYTARVPRERPQARAVRQAPHAEGAISGSGHNEPRNLQQGVKLKAPAILTVLDVHLA